MTRVHHVAVADAAAVGLLTTPHAVGAARRPELIGRAVLPADTLWPGPASGTAVPVGLGDPFPFQTIERLLVQDRRTLVMANDDNPFSNGRRDGAPDDDETISIPLPRPLQGGHR